MFLSPISAPSHFGIFADPIYDEACSMVPDRLLFIMQAYGSRRVSLMEVSRCSWFSAHTKDGCTCWRCGPVLLGTSTRVLCSGLFGFVKYFISSRLLSSIVGLWNRPLKERVSPGHAVLKFIWIDIFTGSPFYLVSYKRSQYVPKGRCTMDIGDPLHTGD